MFGFFKKYDVHLCSAVSGRILNNGEPIANTKVKRELYYTDEKTRIDSTLTDENGCFTLQSIDVRSRTPDSWLCEARTTQIISTMFENVHYKLWFASFHGTVSNAAYDKKLSQLNADLINPNVYFTFKNIEVPHVPYGASSICRWETDFEIQHIIED